MNLIYVDTNIVRDALEDRDNRSGRDIGTPAMSVFSRAEACQFEVVVSTWMLEQAHKQIGKESVKELLNRLRAEDKIVTQTYSDSDIQDAKDVGGDWEDAMHGILAEKADADRIVTRNADDFRNYSPVKPILPEYL